MNGIDRHPFDCPFAIDHFERCVAKINVEMSTTKDVGALGVIIARHVIGAVLKDGDIKVIFGKTQIFWAVSPTNYIFYISTIDATNKIVNTIR
ncbi:hypothetical protein NP590_01085 [Methylomonas sp. SURF-2]|uniref:Uncharacterized protein n=1 Tax=Methylomonas subterranea TaxID=2952225 RepID=A0ABT1TB39_9GAMM|nr:hypothetical protein [Methylomonas sp. SURF-2]MCQ8102682.1 hypothetical protein [Methylomonas sp. SURF-2]